MEQSIPPPEERNCLDKSAAQRGYDGVINDKSVLTGGSRGNNVSPTSVITNSNASSLKTSSGPIVAAEMNGSPPVVVAPHSQSSAASPTNYLGGTIITNCVSGNGEQSFTDKLPPLPPADKDTEEDDELMIVIDEDVDEENTSEGSSSDKPSEPPGLTKAPEFVDVQEMFPPKLTPVKEDEESEEDMIVVKERSSSPFVGKNPRNGGKDTSKQENSIADERINIHGTSEESMTVSQDSSNKSSPREVLDLTQPKTTPTITMAPPVSAGYRTKQSAKVKQFFTTLQTFANNISHNVAEEVQELITALVNGLVTVEEFHQEIQGVTNHPLKDFVIPFLKENLTHFQEELKITSEVLSDILGSTPQPETPTPQVAPEHVERELVVVPSTKPLPAPTTNTVITTPLSPLKAPANLASQSVPPATIHEPLNISPARIEAVPNSTAFNRKRPRDLFENPVHIHEANRTVVQPYPKRPSRPIPTATLTPERPPAVVEVHGPPPPPISAPTSYYSHTPPVPPLSNSPPIQPSHHHPSRPSSVGSAGTPVTIHDTPSPSAQGHNIASNHRLVAHIKEDWTHLETMMSALESMVTKAQKAMSLLKERIQQAGIPPSPLHYRQMEMEREQVISQRVEQAVTELRKQAGEDKQRILMDASRQMREAIRESNKQSNARENCWNCGRKATETCSGCNKARYCGTFCQHKDWDKHMKACIGNRGIRGEKDHPNAHPSHNHASRTTPIPPQHQLNNPHAHIPPGSRIIRTGQTPTQPPYTGSEIFVPIRTDPMANGNSALTTTSSGVAVVTINRSGGEMAAMGPPTM